MHLNEASSWSAEKIADGVIHNVRVLGPVSKNKVSYPKETRDKAVQVMEGSPVNLDHSKPGKASINSRFGKLKNVRNTPDGMVADLHYLTSHPFANAIKEAATTMPDILGMSIQGTGSGKNKDNDGNVIIENIDSISSVDLVSDPATNRTLFEATKPEEEELTTEQHVWAGVKNGIMALLDEDGEPKDKAGKIKEMLKHYDKLYKEEEAGEEDTKTMAAEESVNTELETLKAEKSCRTLCEQNSVDPDNHLLETLITLPAERREPHVKWLKQRSLVKTPRTPAGRTVSEEVKAPDYTRILRGK